MVAYSELLCGVLSLLAVIDLSVMSGLQSLNMAPEQQEEVTVAKSKSKVREVPDFCK